MPHAVSDEETHLDVAIIGAGWYGLTAANTYLKLEPDTRLAVFDKYDTVGGTWAKDRIYPNLVAQVEFGYFNYPSAPMSEDGKPKNNLVTGDMIWKYLDKFAEDNKLKRYIQFNSWVSSVERHPSGGWRLVVNGKVINAAKVVCAAGITTQTNKPDFTIRDDSIPAIHAVEIAKKASTFQEPQNQHFVLLGAAKVIRDDGSGPMPIMPSKMLGMNTITAGANRLMNYLSPSLMTTDTALGGFFHRTMVGRWLTRSYWGYVTSKANEAAGFGGNAGNVEGLKPQVQDNSCFWCESSLGLITMDDFWTTLKKADINIVRDKVDVADSTGVTLRSGKRVNADYVIYATGWGDHFSFFSPELKEELGIPPYGAPVPSKEAKRSQAVSTKVDPWYFHDKAADQTLAKKIPLLAAGPKDLDGWKRPGRKMTVRRWRLYNRTPTISEVQSLWAVAYLLGEVTLPAEEDMIQEIAEWNAWTRRRYGSVGERYPYALFDWIQYLDRLLRDLDVKTQRNGGKIADFFTPYGPHSYNGVVDEYMTVRKPNYRLKYNSKMALRNGGEKASSSSSHSD
ncbi:flavin-binding monooxygenase-like family protein [Truncatella angustata]|uniref:Flavin-binding monooxygenase-like family protein n=1 Tax=Truncatella angustata TaxID=152316 RepID=A0A9P8UBD4_9PEZI|nr:flavin-binding monooxygenase-like family protein [Truncatella angustata]KAH6643364.1 flavin-binding monooxygenase-like family protein [Truncatella angustata]